ncbi:glycogen debranching protein [Streptomyces sp. t39]|nr:glycogen debranching protein [Streptomyces sp. t39]
MAPNAVRRATAPHQERAALPAAGRTVPSAPEPPPVHHTLMCVALPALAVSPLHGQLDGHGIEGVYRSGGRLLSRCLLRVAGRAPLPLRSRILSAECAEFTGAVRTSATGSPDPDVLVERTRDAHGTERIVLQNLSATALRLPVEIALATDLARFGAVAAGRPGPELAGSVHDTGIRWAPREGTGGAGAVVTADPAPDTTLASSGLLRWEIGLAPGASRTISLSVRPGPGAPRRDAALSRPAAAVLVPAPAVECDDGRLAPLVEGAVGDLRALLCRDPARPDDASAAAGVPWRMRPAPADALWAARAALPLSTRLASAALRMAARGQRSGSGPGSGLLPGELRAAGPHVPPGCTGTEATLAFPVVLAEAWRWGLPERDLAELLPVAERCLGWLRRRAGDSTAVEEAAGQGFLRSETQAHAHRAAVLGAGLLDAAGRPGGAYWREWAAELRTTFPGRFWTDDVAGGRPVAGCLPDGRPVGHLGSAAAHLLDTGLAAGGVFAPGLLDAGRTARLARLLGDPAIDSGWGLRSLGEGESAYNPLGHRSGAVRVHETAVAVAALAAAGFEREAAGLARGLLDAAEAFGHRLPEMFAGLRRTPGGGPVPHPAACRPAALGAASALLLATALTGIRPDAPAGTVALRPMRAAPLGPVRISGLRVAGEPFALRVSARGLAVVEEAAEGLQLGV